MYRGSADWQGDAVCWPIKLRQSNTGEKILDPKNMPDVECFQMWSYESVETVAGKLSAILASVQQSISLVIKENRFAQADLAAFTGGIG